MTLVPVKYNDPLYAELARRAEAKYRLPQGILDAIRTRGERSNANQVSEAGARSVYQFIPPTRQGMMKNYGIDPWKDAASATEGAGALMAENYRRSHNWNQAVSMYHGGLDKRNWGSRTQAYTQRVDQHKEEAPDMGQSMYPAPYYGGVDPLAPERPKQPVPVEGDPGPSVSIPAAAPVAAKKRGGILGALESVFMPDPDSLWAGALRGGIWDAKTNQAEYKQKAAAQAIDTSMAQAKLKNLLTKGEYQIAGNNVIHFPADGGAPEVITPPATPSEHERLITAWRNEADPTVKDLMERMLLGANNPELVAGKQSAAENVARIRAGATTGAANIRAKASGSKKSSLPPLPPGFSVVK